MSKLILADCPFCRGLAELVEIDKCAGAIRGHVAHCTQCGSTSGVYPAPRYAADAWNKRA